MSIRKRGNSFQVVYRCPGEQTPRTETYKSEEEATIRDMQIKLSKKNGTFSPNPRHEKTQEPQVKDITVREFMEEYITVYGLKTWGNSYYTANLALIKNYILPYLGDRTVRSVKVKDIDTFYTFLLNIPASLKYRQKDNGRKISSGTISRIHKLLKSAFGRAVAWEYTSINPTIGATLPRYSEKEREVWSDSEAIQALKICDNDTLRICMYLALGCSMRIGEILGLQWKNVYIGSEVLMNDDPHLKIDKELCRCSAESIDALENVNRSTIIIKFPPIMPKKASTRLVLKAPKTESSNRTVYLPQAVIDELKFIKAKQDEFKTMLGNEYHDYDLVVSQINGRPYDINIIDKMFQKFIKDNSLRSVVFHSLRHSSTSLKLKLSRGNIKAVQGDTGHAEARMVTDTYAHGFDEDRKLIAKEMDTGFFSKVSEGPSKSLDEATMKLLSGIVKEHPELIKKLLAEGVSSQNL